MVLVADGYVLACCTVLTGKFGAYTCQPKGLVVLGLVVEGRGTQRTLTTHMYAHSPCSHSNPNPHARTQTLPPTLRPYILTHEDY